MESCSGDESDLTEFNDISERDLYKNVETNRTVRYDWYGNNALHHALAKDQVDIDLVKKILEDFPLYASSKNQFGRIPLHYALDRIKVDIKGLETLLEIYPVGVKVTDNDNNTPYDVALKWEHSKNIINMLLNAEPTVDYASYLIMKYGTLGKMYIWMHNLTVNKRIHSDHDGDHRDNNEEEQHCNINASSSMDQNNIDLLASHSAALTCLPSKEFDEDVLTSTNHQHHPRSAAAETRALIPTLEASNKLNREDEDSETIV